jgi:hypothetical protein
VKPWELSMSASKFGHYHVRLVVLFPSEPPHLVGSLQR